MDNFEIIKDKIDSLLIDMEMEWNEGDISIYILEDMEEIRDLFGDLNE